MREQTDLFELCTIQSARNFFGDMDKDERFKVVPQLAWLKSVTKMHHAETNWISPTITKIFTKSTYISCSRTILQTCF